MQLVRILINNQGHRYEHFSYYEILIKEIEASVVSRPDICIETCKSLLEGISKTILKELDPTVSHRGLDTMDFPVLFKRALSKLAEHNQHIEEGFVRRSCSLVQLLAELRNKRGDISHGRIAPKELLSYSQFSKLVAQVTEGIAFYILEQFFAVDLSYKDDVKYQNHQQFNQMLDESNPLGDISYSRALFDQDYTSYSEQLSYYQSEQEQLSQLQSQ